MTCDVFFMLPLHYPQSPLSNLLSSEGSVVLRRTDILRYAEHTAIENCRWMSTSSTKSCTTLRQDNTGQNTLVLYVLLRN